MLKRLQYDKLALLQLCRKLCPYSADRPCRRTTRVTTATLSYHEWTSGDTGDAGDDQNFEMYWHDYFQENPN